MAALRGLLVLNTPVSAVVVSTLPLAPIRATTRGTVVTHWPEGWLFAQRRSAIGRHGCRIECAAFTP